MTARTLDTTAEEATAVAPESAPGTGGPGPLLSPPRLLALQRTAGNAAVGALLQRAPAAAADPQAEAPGMVARRKLLSDGAANGAIAHMGGMSPNEAGWALGKEDPRSLAVKAFDDEEMAHAMYALRGGSLLQKLNWMVVEGASYKLVKP